METETSNQKLDTEKKEKHLHEDISLDDVNLQNVDFDSILHYLGKNGKYQMTQVFLQCVCYVAMSLPILHGVFVGKFVDFHCSDKDASFKGLHLFANQTLELSECHVEVKDNVTSHVLHKETCTKHDYNGGDTIVSYISEWDLVCDKEVLGQLPQILLLVGQGFGAGFITPFGDRFGRKKLVLANVLGLFATMLLSAFVRQFELFLVLRFLIGAFIQGAGVAIGTMMLEVLPIQLRPWVTLAQSFSWIVALTWTGVLGYLFRDEDWRMLQIAYTLISGVPAILSLFFIDESLRWLVGNSKVKEVTIILKKACRWNDKTYETLVNKISSNTLTGVCDLQLKGTKNQDKGDNKDTNQPDVKCRVIDLIKNKNARTITFVMCYTWFVTALTYYGIILMSTSLAGDPYVNFFLTSIIELPGGILGFYLLKYLDRKPFMIGFNLAAAAALLLVVLVAHVAPPGTTNDITQICLTLLGQIFVIQIFLCVWVYTPELFPTNLRNIGLGISSSSARVGSSFSPLFTILARKIPWAPGALFGGGCLISAFVLTLIPETRRVPLPVTLQDVDDMFEKKEKKKTMMEDCAMVSLADAADGDLGGIRRREKV